MGSQRSQHLIVVTGVPGAGKSTLAGPLADALNLPLFSLDRIKESLYDVAGAALTSRWALREAAEAVLGALLPDASAGAVVDIWLDPGRNDRSRLRAMLPEHASVCEVLCQVSPDVAVARYRRRVRGGPHLPADVAVLDRIRAAAAVENRRRDDGSDLGPVVRVDTDGTVRLPEVVAAITASRHR
jgi:predicted kinase